MKFENTVPKHNKDIPEGINFKSTDYWGTPVGDKAKTKKSSTPREKINQKNDDIWSIDPHATPVSKLEGTNNLEEIRDSSQITSPTKKEAGEIEFRRSKSLAQTEEDAKKLEAIREMAREKEAQEKKDKEKEAGVLRKIKNLFK